MAIEIVTNPISDMTAIFLERYPHIDAQIVIVDGLWQKETSGAVTLWPDDGSRTTIAIDSCTTMLNIIDVLAHELAHVVAGFDAGHGAAWLEVYTWAVQRWSEKEQVAAVALDESGRRLEAEAVEEIDRVYVEAPLPVEVWDRWEAWAVQHNLDPDQSLHPVVATLLTDYVTQLHSVEVERGLELSTFHLLNGGRGEDVERWLVEHHDYVPEVARAVVLTWQMVRWQR